MLRYSYPRAVLYGVTLSIFLSSVAEALSAPSSSDVEVDATQVALSRPLGIAFLEWENGTGETCFSHWGMISSVLLARAFASFPGVHISPGVDWAVRKLGINLSGHVGARSARAVGQMINADRVIWGCYTYHGGSWDVTIRIENVGTGEVSNPITATSEDWFDIRDHLVDQILKQLPILRPEEEPTKLHERWCKSSKALNYFIRAEADRETGRPLPQIESELYMALQNDSCCIPTLVSLSAVLAREEKMDAAKRLARVALGLAPKDPDVHRLLAVFALSAGDYSEAQQEIKATLRSDPQDPKTLELLGTLHVQQGMLSRAVADFTNCISSNPFSAGPYARLAETFAMERRFDLALTELHEAERFVSPNDLKTEQVLCLAYARCRCLPLAIEHCQRLLAIANSEQYGPQRISFWKKALLGWSARFVPAFQTNVFKPLDYSEEDIALTLRRTGLEEIGLKLLPDPLTANAQMSQVSHMLTKNGATELQKAELLFEQIAPHADGPPGPCLTAQQAFEIYKLPPGQINCFAASCLYVSMVRTLGLKAYVALVTESCDGSKAPHACAAVWMRDKYRMVLVDPSLMWFGARHKSFLVLDDLETLAIEMSNSTNLTEVQMAYKLAPHVAIIQGNLIQKLIDNRDWYQARGQLQSFLRVESSNWMGYYFQGQFAVHEGRLDDAVRLLQEANRISPDSYEVDSVLGNVFLTKGDLKGAREAYQRALQCPHPLELERRVEHAIGQIDELLAGVDADMTKR